MPVQSIPPPGLPGPQNKSHELLAVLARFAARARLTGPRLAGVPAQGQMAAFKVGTLWVPFWINPMTYRETTAAIKQDLPTPGLVRRSYFTARPTQMYLEGTTGTAGWDARTGGMADLGRMKPFVASPMERIEFHYPYMFTEPRYCYINRFVQQTTPEAPLLYYYQIELSAYPRQDNLPCRVAPQAVEGLSVAPVTATPKKVPATPAARRKAPKVTSPVDRNPITATVPIQQTVTLQSPTVPVKPVDSRIWWASQISAGSVHKPATPAVEKKQATQAAGAALAMASELRDRYNLLTWIFNRARNDILISNLSTQVAHTLTAAVAAFLVGGLAAYHERINPAQEGILAFAAQAVATTGAAMVAQGAENLPGLKSGEYDVVICTAFDALMYNNGAYVAGDGGTRDLWVGGLVNDWSFFEGSKTSGASATNLPWQALLLTGLLQFAPDGEYKAPAEAGMEHPADLSKYCASWPKT